MATSVRKKTAIFVEGCKIWVWNRLGAVVAQADECDAIAFPNGTNFDAAARSYFHGN